MYGTYSVVLWASPLLLTAVVLITAGVSSPRAGAGRGLMWGGSALLAASYLSTGLLPLLVVPLAQGGAVVYWTMTILLSLIPVVGVVLLIRGIVAAATGAGTTPSDDSR